MITLRPWLPTDTEFCLTVRNHPELMKYFRQDEPVSYLFQLRFIENDTDYNGQVIEFNGQPVGLCAIKDSGEFSIAILPAYQKRGIATKTMQLLINKHFGLWSAVFINNPALGWYLSKLGFKIRKVTERHYHKAGYGLIDTVTIYHD